MSDRSRHDELRAAPVRGRAKAGSHRLPDAEYAERLEQQGGGCAICGATPKTRRLHTDRDHRTGEVRGLLCHRCNRALPVWITARWTRRAYEYLGGELCGRCGVDVWDEPHDRWCDAE